MANYLDSTGLTHLWSKIKAAIAAHKATVTQTVTTGTELAEVDGVKIYAPEASGGGGKVYAATLNSVQANVTAALNDQGYMTATWQTIKLDITANGRRYDVQALAYVTYNKTTGLMSARVHDFVGHTYSGTTGYTIQPAKAWAALGLFTIAGIPATDAATFENGLLVIKTLNASASNITTVPAFNVIETQQKTA
jgi:hypothetical protein